MEVYQSQFLEIEYSEGDNILSQTWSNKDITCDEFQREMLRYREFLTSIKPKKVLWKHMNFSLNLPKLLFDWIEDEINVPGKLSGVSKIGFVISKDFYSQLSVMNSFEKTNSVFRPKYFLSENDANLWLLNDKVLSENDKSIHDPNSRFQIEDIDENSITLRLDKRSPTTINFLNRIVSENQFFRNNLHKFNDLTEREVEVLWFLANGKTSKEIGEELFISKLTADTHRKNIFEKLQVKTYADLFMFAKVFINSY